MDCDDRDYLKGWGFDSNVCNLCGKKNSEVNGLLMQCGRCKKVYYCSRQCFNDGLPDHNLVCYTIEKITRDPTLSKDSTPLIPSLESKSKQSNEYIQQKAKPKKVTQMDEPSSVPRKVNEDLIYTDHPNESRKSSKESKKVKKKEIPGTSSHQNTDDNEDRDKNEAYNSLTKKLKKQKQPSSKKSCDIPLFENMESHDDEHGKDDKSNVTDKGKKKSKKERRSSVTNNPIDDTTDEISGKKDNNKQIQPTSENTLDVLLSENTEIPDDKHVQSDKSTATDKDRKKSKKARRSSVSNAQGDDTADKIPDPKSYNEQIQPMSENALDTPISENTETPDDKYVQSAKSALTDKDKKKSKKERRSCITNATDDDTADEILDPKNNKKQIQPTSEKTFSTTQSDGVDVSGDDNIKSGQFIATEKSMPIPKKERRSSVANDAIVDKEEETSDILEQSPELLKKAVLVADDSVVTPTITDINDATCPGNRVKNVAKKTMQLDKTEEYAMQQPKARSPQQIQSRHVMKTDTITNALNNNEDSRDTVDISDSDDCKEETIVEVSVTVDRIKSEPEPVTIAESWEPPNVNDKKQWTASRNLRDNDNKKGMSYGRGKRLDKAKDADKGLQLRQVSKIAIPAKGQPQQITSGNQQGGYVTGRENPSTCSIPEMKDCDQDLAKHAKHDGKSSVIEERSSTHYPLVSEIAPRTQRSENRQPTIKLRPNRSEETDYPRRANRNDVETCLSSYFSDIPTAKIYSYLGDLTTYDNNLQTDTEELTIAKHHQRQQKEGIVGKNEISLGEAVNKCNVSGTGDFDRNKISDGSNRKLHPTEISKKTYGWEIPEWASKQRNSHANRIHYKHDEDVATPESISLPLFSMQATDEVDAETEDSIISIVAESESVPLLDVSKVAKKVEYPLYACLDTAQNQQTQSPSPQLQPQASNINTEEKLASNMESDVVDTSGSDEWEEETIVEVSVTVERMPSYPKPSHRVGTLVLTNEESSTTQVSNINLQGDYDKQQGSYGGGNRFEKRKDTEQATRQLHSRTDPLKENPYQENEEISLNNVEGRELQLEGLGPIVVADEFQPVTKRIERDGAVKHPAGFGKVVRKQKIDPKLLVGKLGVSDLGETKRLAVKVLPKHADLFRVRGMGRSVKLRRDDVENHLATILSRIPAERIASYLSDDDIKVMTNYENDAPTHSKDEGEDNSKPTEPETNLLSKSKEFSRSDHIGVTEPTKTLELKKPTASLPCKKSNSKSNQLRPTDIERKTYGWEVPEWANRQRNSHHGYQLTEISNRSPFADDDGAEGSSESIVSSRLPSRIEDAELATCTEKIVIPMETVENGGILESETEENGAIASIPDLVEDENNNVGSEECSDDDVSVDDEDVKTGTKRSIRSCGKLAASRLSAFGKETKECEREKLDWTTNRSLRGCTPIKKEYGWEKPEWVDKATSLHSRNSFTMTSNNPATALSMNDDDTSSNDNDSLCGEDFDTAANSQNQHFIAEVNEGTTQPNKKQESESPVENKTANHDYVIPMRREDLLDHSSEHSRVSSSICSVKSMNSLQSYGSCQSRTRVSQHNYQQQTEKDCIQSKPPSWTNNIFLRTTEKGRVLKDKGDIVLPSKPSAILDSGKVKWEKPDWVSKTATLRKVSSKETMH